MKTAGVPCGSVRQLKGWAVACARAVGVPQTGAMRTSATRPAVAVCCGVWAARRVSSLQRRGSASKGTAAISAAAATTTADRTCG
eukprot:8504846-Alexandrium_andersonii.AAC.1